MRALALFSGGLDSVLAMKVLIDQGIEVVAVNVNFGFGGTKDRKKHMENMCKQVGAKLEILDLRKEYLDEVLFSPKYGYGSAYNPCIDCHGFMFRYTKQLLKKYDAQFMISGEVLGQRPMSQRKEALGQVKKLSTDEEDIILRPLSAKLLPQTKPEREGWVNRDLLLDIEGRSRARQMELVKQYNISDYEPPAGGCMLTEQNTAIRIKDFMKYEATMEVNDIDTLKYGRHLRLPDGAKLIVGRHKEDNESLKNTSSNKYSPLLLVETTGPYSLLANDASDEDLKLAVKIVLTYGKTKAGETYKVKIGQNSYEGIPASSKEFIQQYMI